MTPNYELAATKALETLIEHNVRSSPVDPLAIVKQTKGVIAMPFAELAANAGVERKNLVPMFGMNQDAVTFYVDIGRLKYVVAYNQYLPFDMIRRGLARELGHIVLGHDGTRPSDVRMAEAMCFARHLLFPRPLIHALQEAGFPMTVEVVGSITGCYERCLAGLRKTPGVEVSAELNCKVRDMFADFVRNFTEFQTLLSAGDRTSIADFGSFMDKYEE